MSFSTGWNLGAYPVLLRQAKRGREHAAKVDSLRVAVFNSLKFSSKVDDHETYFLTSQDHNSIVRIISTWGKKTPGFSSVQLLGLSSSVKRGIAGI